MTDFMNVRLADTQLNALLELARVVELGPGDVVFRRGEPGLHIYVVLKGSVELVFGGAKEPKRLLEGALFGELAALLPEMHRSADALVVEPSNIAIWDTKAIEEIVASNPRAVLDIIVRSCRYLIASEEGLIQALQRRNEELERALDYLRRTREELSANEILAQSDPLTGLYNRRCMDKQLPRFMERSDETGAGLVLLLGDLDGFKAVNDRCGHAEGDRILVRVAGLISASIRRTDLACRMGGDEFALILPETTPEEARVIAERLVAHIASLSAEHEGETLSLSLSVGAVVYRQGEGIAEFIKRADALLYSAKKEGGACVVWEDANS